MLMFIPLALKSPLENEVDRKNTGHFNVWALTAHLEKNVGLIQHVILPSS